MHTKASRLRKSRSPKVDPASGNRLPPGQVLTERFPILHEGAVPEYDTGDWSLRLFGTLDRPIELRYADLQALPQRVLRCDIHCVTRWSKFDTEWGGVHLQDLLQAFDIQPTSSYVMAHADPDYQTNLLLDDLLHPQSLLATHYAGQPLTAQHGWPLRLVIAGRYFWKSAKWLRGLEFVAQEQPGFWEQNGFHLHADPFAEQRFSGEELDIAEDAWLEKEFD
ncbi:MULTISPECIES: sulfite oxidase-like oxidoreductase [Pseudomonas fluorescens group]|uniref:sulfite oxidase-like oxidoreductase n=1 Tax=Pseudomonas fluorescens group TaxID=136843 RepID=UPI00087AC136|nr:MULTISPECIES: sulfite oxidase-like oxidoreductase [Pseudomonas fluorescens group]UVL48189.1 sulfite oxidase-like oxidoreductase [Pseudomonas moraviensis]SDU44968.1 Oxidoreductase molybdopterin binding domain-containing protein [Pseudomonas moraviensis]